MHAASLSQQRTLLGAGKTTIDQTYNLSAMIQGHPQEVVVNAQADGVVVSTQEGGIYYFYHIGNDLSLRQRFVPFGLGQSYYHVHGFFVWQRLVGVR